MAAPSSKPSTSPKPLTSPLSPLPPSTTASTPKPSTFSSPTIPFPNLSPSSPPTSKPIPPITSITQHLQPTTTTQPSSTSAFRPPLNPRRPSPQHTPYSDPHRTESLWREMQATLADVELSAAQGTHFFGPAHASALDELRSAQIALAGAWGRSGDGEAVSPAEDEIGARRGSEGSPGSPGRKREEGTRGFDGGEGDILAARKRREANDRYFYRVSRGVVEVVGRLEGVAAAMARVERESRGVWSESGVESGSGEGSEEGELGGVGGEEGKE